MATTGDHRERAAAIHADLPVVDGHNDLPWRLRLRDDGDLDSADPREHLDGYHTDTPRLLAGGVGAQFWSVYVPAWTERPFDVTMQQLDLVERMVGRDPCLEHADTAEDVRRIRAAGRIASLAGAEGGHCIEGSLEKLRSLRRRGVRYLTLTHGDTIDWADSATDEPRHGGLTDFGRAVVKEMNRIGMLVDISHVSADTMRDALAVSERPVIASHSGAFALVPHPRNVPDDVLEGITSNDGVVMVVFYPGFLVAETAVKALDMFAEARRLAFELDDELAVDAALAERTADWDRGSVSAVADHIEHIARVAGVDHVGLGSDFDGMHLVPAGLEDVSRYPGITAELLARDWSETHVRKVLGENALRVLAAAD